MNTFILILAALNIGVPVRCYESPTAWKEAKVVVNTIPNAIAFYQPNASDPFIALGPRVCKEVRTPTLYGAFILAHELAHLQQDRNDTPFDEQEADDIGRLWSLKILHRLEKLYKRKAPPLVILEP